MSTGRLLGVKASAFLALVAGALGVAFWVSRQLSDPGRPELVSLALTVDFLVGLPVAYYLLVARPRGLSPLTVGPVALCGFVVLRLAVPAEHASARLFAEGLILPLELCVLWAVSRRMRAALGAARGAGDRDPLEALVAEVRSSLPARRAAEAVASELAVLHFAFFSWREAPHVPDGHVGVTTHRRSNHGPILVVVFLVLVAEGLVVHLLLERWSPTVAWIATGLGAYGGVWLFADWRATVLRPFVIGADELWLRAGLRWQARIPRARLRAVVAQEPTDAGTVLQTTLGVPATRWLVFEEPVEVTGPYGFRRTVEVLALAPDDVDAVDALSPSA